jgi:hypothetical protein
VADPSYVHVALATTLLSGDPSADQVLVGTGGAHAQTWSGDYSSFQAYCSDPLATPIPGAATGVLLVETGVEVGDMSVASWLPTTGGVGLSAGVVDPSDLTVTAYTASDCSLRLGPAAAGTAATGLVRVDAAFGCAYGFADS